MVLNLNEANKQKLEFTKINWGIIIGRKKKGVSLACLMYVSSDLNYVLNRSALMFFFVKYKYRSQMSELQASK